MLAMCNIVCEWIYASHGCIGIGGIHVYCLHTLWGQMLWGLPMPSFGASSIFNNKVSRDSAIALFISLWWSRMAFARSVLTTPSLSFK